MKTFTIEATSVSITPESRGAVSIEADDVDEVTLLEQIDISDVVSHYSVNDLLEAIGRDAAIEHFEILEVEEA